MRLKKPMKQANVWKFSEDKMMIETEKQLSREAIVEKIKAIVDEEFGNFELNIKTIGEEKLFLTPDYVGRVFKKVTGESLKDYINRIRVEKAKELIKKNKYKIYEVAKICGFDNNAKYFSCVFKKITGVYPKEF